MSVNSTSSPAAIREVQALVRGQPTSDGMGVRLTRIIGQYALPEIDPFLLLDEFKSDRPTDYIGGFPDHPHRGFDTVTYMIDGRMRHWDNQGHSGLLKPGGAQWMTAGRGLVHSEMPEQQDGLLWGFQLWVNLPGSEKMTAPRYQDIEPDAIPEVAPADGVLVRVIAGRFGNVAGPVQAVATDPTYFDVALAAGVSFAFPIAEGHTVLVYPFNGDMTVGEGATAVPVQRGDLAVLGDGGMLKVAAGEGPCRFLIIAGRPLNEPIARHGPFVMNTAQELRQAFMDYRDGKF